MKIEINRKKYEIKPASELTVKEYISFFSRISENPTQMEILICYIATLTGLDYKDITSVSIDDHSIRRLSVYIGEIKAPDKMESLFYFYHKKSGTRIYQKLVNWRSFGTRRLMEDRKAGNQLELAVYLLAIYINNNYDNDSIEEIYNELQDYNATNVFGFIFFFIKKFRSGEKLGLSFFQLLWLKVLISIKKSLSRLRAKD